MTTTLSRGRPLQVCRCGQWHYKTIIHLPSSNLFHHPSDIMSEVSEAIQAKCLAFSDRIIKLNDYLLEQAANKHQPSSFSHHPSRVPVHLQSVAALANQLLRSGTSIGANNAEACNAITKSDFKSKSYIALKEARESLYWIPASMTL